jgi:hypothetical protein
MASAPTRLRLHWDRKTRLIELALGRCISECPYLILCQRKPGRNEHSSIRRFLAWFGIAPNRRSNPFQPSFSRIAVKRDEAKQDGAQRPDAHQ